MRIRDDPSPIRISEVSEQGNGKARLYTKEPSFASQTGAMAALTMPIYTSGVMLYNAGRFLAMPIYILANLAKFSILDIPKEMARSLGRILQAPFYGLALFFASLYAVLDPLNGIKLGAAIEYEWNAHVPMRNEGVWMMGQIAFEEWKWEGEEILKRWDAMGFTLQVAGSPILKFPLKTGKSLQLPGVDGSKVSEDLEIFLPTA